MTRSISFLLALTYSLLLSISLTARSLPDSSLSVELRPSTLPTYCAAMHTVGNLHMSVTNYGCFATGPSGFIVGTTTDWFTGSPILACEYPRGSHNQYCFVSALWIGAIVGEDTLVSAAVDGWQQSREMNPLPNTVLVRKSTVAIAPDELTGAISEQDYISQYTDTFTTEVPNRSYDFLDHRSHRPLKLSVEQRSYTWSMPSMDDFIFFDFTVRNIGSDSLHQAYIGVYVDADVLGDIESFYGSQDDIAGFRKISRIAATEGCSDGYSDSIPIAWIADNDGNIVNPKNCPGVTGMAVLRVPLGAEEFSFNWWVSNGTSSLDFGPRKIANRRDFGTGGTGTPLGDRNKYFLLSNHEIDFDQVFTFSISEADSVWDYPTNRSLAGAVSQGFDTRYLISFGPLDLAPNEEAPFTLAYVAGEKLHHSGNYVSNLPYYPQGFMENLDFSSLEHNVRTAARAYDVPGYDSDQDGYAGRFEICGNDTMYLTGDGVPDFMPVADCGVARTGNVNGDLSDQVDLLDLSLLVAFLTGLDVSVHCSSEANVTATGGIDLSDLSWLISYLTIPGSVELPWCR